jgi:endonuclease YncB( thermonuclease family)
MRIALTLCLLVLMVTGEASAGRIVTGVVRAVYDGDTVLLATREESHLKVRLYGIDAPETRKPDQPGQPFGDASKRTLMKKIMGRQVSAEIITVDQYKRVVAVIRSANRDINREMVAEGMAWAYRQYLHAPYTSEYIGSESRARSQQAGLWRDTNPLPPWEYRHALKNVQGHRKRW